MGLQGGKLKILGVIAAVVIVLTSVGAPANSAEVRKYAPYITFYWGSSTSSPAKPETGTWLIREVEVTESTDSSYFSIIGNWTPPFYLGLQQLNWRNGSTEFVALFSAWDTYEGNEFDCGTCSPESRVGKGALTRIKALGPGVSPGVFGYEGTGVQAWMDDLRWKVGDTVRAVVNLRPSARQTEISVALQRNNDPWRFFGTHVYDKRYETLEPGYSFIEDWWGNPHIKRSAQFSNSWMEDEALDNILFLDKVDAIKSTRPQDGENHQILQRNSSGLWASSGGSEKLGPDVFRARVTQQQESVFIPTAARIAALNLSGLAAVEYASKHGRSVQKLLDKKAQEVAAQLAAEAEAKRIAEEAVAKARAEAEAQASEEARVIAEAAAKARAAAQASEEARVIAEAAARNAAAAAAAPKPRSIICRKGTQTRSVTAVAPKCPAGFRVQVTLTCQKGTVIRKVSGISPRCPSGFKRR